MNTCKYCNQEAPYTLKDSENNTFFLCDRCYHDKKRSFAKDKVKPFSTNLDELK